MHTQEQSWPGEHAGRTCPCLPSVNWKNKVIWHRGDGLGEFLTVPMSEMHKL